MLPTKRHGLPSVGRLTFSAQNWRAWAYATIFSCCISQMSQQVKKESSGSKKFLDKGTAVQVDPDGCSSLCIVHLPSSGGKKRPTPHMLSFHCHPPQALWLTPATSWVFCTFKPSRPPTSAALLLGFGGGHLHILFPQTLSWPLEEVGDLWLQFWWFPQIDILCSCLLSLRLWTP